MTPKEIFDALYGADSIYNPYSPNYQGENSNNSTTTTTDGVYQTITTTTTDLGWGMTTTATIPQDIRYEPDDGKLLTFTFDKKHTFLLNGQPIIIEPKGHLGMAPCYIGGAGVGGYVCSSPDFRYVLGGVDFGVAGVDVEYDDGSLDVSVGRGPNVDVGEGLQGGHFELSSGISAEYTKGEYWYNFTLGGKGEAGGIGTSFPASGSGGIEIKIPFHEVAINPSGGELKFTFYPRTILLSNPLTMPLSILSPSSYSYTFKF